MDQAVFIKNFGCSANTADGEVLAGCLKQAGYKITDSETEADLIIYNSCAVKGPTENRIINEIKHAPNGKKVVVAGCLPKISFERLTKETHFDGCSWPSNWRKNRRSHQSCFRRRTNHRFGGIQRKTVTLPYYLNCVKTLQ